MLCKTFCIEFTIQGDFLSFSTIANFSVGRFDSPISFLVVALDYIVFGESNNYNSSSAEQENLYSEKSEAITTINDNNKVFWRNFTP